MKGKMKKDKIELKKKKRTTVNLVQWEKGRLTRYWFKPCPGSEKERIIRRRNNQKNWDGIVTRQTFDCMFVLFIV